MTGVYLEKVSKGGQTFWAAKDEATRKIISIADSPSGAIQTYEIIIENENISKQLGVSTEDMDI